MEEQLKTHLNKLTGIRPYRNCWNLDALEEAAAYIENEFRSYGLKTDRQSWTARSNSYDNVITKYRPDKEQRLVIGANYDVFGNQSGADDNTSGVAGLLVLAEQIMATKPDLPYGIDFVAYCLEEPPFFGTADMGSYQHAQLLFNSKTPVIGMICLDMIGYFSTEPNSQNYPVPELAEQYPSIGNFIALIGHSDYSSFNKEIYRGMKQENRLNIESLEFSSNKGLAGLSDHRNYWLFGYPAIMINDTASYRNPNYHKKTDTPETLNYEIMEYVIQAVLKNISSPINVEATIAEKHPLHNEKTKQQAKLSCIKRFFKKLFG